MSDPLYIAAKMALYQFRVKDLFENAKRNASFNETLSNLENAIWAYEVMNSLTPVKHDFSKFDRNSGSYLDNIEETGQ